MKDLCIPISGRAQKQSGFGLLEISIVLALLASAMVAYMALQMTTTRIDQGQVIGAQYARINDGLGQYMTLHHVALKKLPPGCSVHGLASVSSKTRPTGLACGLTINGTSMVNGLQPKAAELVALGLLNEGTTDTLILGYTNTISEPAANGTVSSNNWTPPRLLPVITQRCVSTGSTSNLRGRYVLVRRPTSGTSMALDEIEVMNGGSNIASSAVLSSSPTYTDAAVNAANYYGLANLVDRQLTLSPPAAGVAYQTPGLFRSRVTAGVSSWVQLDLGFVRDISSIGVRTVRGNAGATGDTWEQEGSSLAVEISHEAVNPATGRFVSTATSQIRSTALTAASVPPATPGNMRYVVSSEFSDPLSVDLTPTAQGCPNGSMMELSSLLFNTQPYTVPGWQGSGAMLATVVKFAGNEAVMSNPVGVGELTRQGISITNPLRYYNPNPQLNDIVGTGVGGIIAVRNGYDSYSATLQTRSDGSNLPTAAWNFNGKNLTGVDTFSSASANVSGDISAQGALSANQGAFNALKLPVSTAGSTCSNATETIAQTSTGLLMNCIGSKWKSVVADTVSTREYYQVDISQNTASAYAVTTQYCSNGTCSTATSVLGTPSLGAFATTLKTAEWFPVLGGYQILQDAGSPAANKTLSGVFNLRENGLVWSLYFKGSDLTLLKLRFYKINT